VLRTRPNRYRLAVARDTDGRLRRRAWKVILSVEGAYFVFAMAARFAIPHFSWLAVALLWIVVILLLGGTIWLLSREQGR
jgi:hypothetical protein